ncbi:pregnancy-specific glycoprotein 22-like isoform X1 [Rhineura floridana]|uniref:pregnancy-specific glycoprotein 22-like isoform X1 n=1 Tax=Rhineura floridana TaxID=261503 RepID=UPI002AC7F58B|nr:pregnancy-specific glycoprotein 22-like isoform X1 [Rhineura floridana]
MMGLHSSRQGSLKALLLTGFILSCVLQLVPAQRRLSVMVEPSNPKVGQNITLTLWGSPSSFVQCQWSRETRSGGSGTIATYSPQSRDQQRQGSAYSGRETVYRNCSLHITRLTQLDTGNYTVEIEEAPVQQPDQEQDTEGKVHRASVYLQVSDYIPIQVTSKPLRPSLNQEVTLTPQNVPAQFDLCRWIIQTHTNTREKVLLYIPRQTVQQSSPQERKTVREDCSLHIALLAASDTGNYTVQIEVPVNRQQEPWKEIVTQKPERRDSQVYMGHIYLKPLQQSDKEPHKGGSASLSYSAGVIAGALFGSLAWAGTLRSLFSELFCSFVSLRPKVLP